MFSNSILRTLPLVLVAACSASADELVWQQLTAAAPWAPRYNHSVALHEDKMVLVAGQYITRPFNDVWMSHDGVEWEQVLSVAHWRERADASLVSFAGKLYLIGGTQLPIPMGDVWVSDDGYGWTQVFQSVWSNDKSEKDDSPFLPRIWDAATAFRGNLVIAGGVRFNRDGTRPTYGNDVWIFDSKQWHRATDAAWQPRANHTLTAFKDHLYVIGGEIDLELPDSGYSSEVWRTSDVSDWTLVSHAPWLRRSEHLTLATDAALFVLGGTHAGARNDVWMSRDGEHWEQVGFLPHKCGRNRMAGLAMGNKLYLFGGWTEHEEHLSDVWVADLATVLN
jgi:hypothetical protein